MNTETEFSNVAFLKNALKRILPNSQAVALAIILGVGFLLVYFLADFLMPVFASVVIAYLLDGVVAKAESKKVPRFAAVLTVFSAFMGFLIFFLFVLMPIVYEQALQLLQQIPDMLSLAQRQIMRLPQMYPKFVSTKNIREIMFAVQNELIKYSQSVLSVSAASLMGLITGMLYLILVPVLVFFLLKDKRHILDWLTQFMPKDRHLSMRVWEEMDVQLGNYVRGKFIEIVILWSASYVTFATMSLNYAMLLAVFMGLSVVIPYVGATLVTFPVLGVAYFQWGMTDPFMYILIAYAIIQTIDGVVLVPLLFSEAVNLHPIAIIVAILFFGGIWGFWGVFFAIPLATLVKSVITAWPRLGDKSVSYEGL
ncbi:MAG: AI-2E family transporter [Gammaproteobacteria bacterium]